MLLTPVSIVVNFLEGRWRRLSLDGIEFVLSCNVHDLQGIFERYASLITVVIIWCQQNDDCVKVVFHLFILRVIISGFLRDRIIIFCMTVACIATNYVTFLKFFLFSILLNFCCPRVCNVTIFSADFFFNLSCIYFLTNRSSNSKFSFPHYFM
jgi:hypothetical protein